MYLGENLTGRGYWYVLSMYKKQIKGDDEVPYPRGRAVGKEARQRTRGQVLSGLASQVLVRLYLERKAIRNVA